MTRLQWLRYCEKLIQSGRVTPQEAVHYVRYLYNYEKILKISKKVKECQNTTKSPKKS